jgi:amidase
MIPADRAAIYTLKPTIGIVSQDGLIPVSRLCDTAGPMTKSSRDLALLLDVLVDSSTTKVPDGGYVSSVTGSWGKIRVGVLKPSDWYLKDPPLKYIKEAEDQMVSPSKSTYV